MSVLLLCLGICSQAQLIEIKFGVDGLTCSQCSRSVEMQLRKLNFVKEVNMDLEHTEGIIQPKANTGINFNQIGKAIEDAGFSVRFIQADFDIQKLKTEGQCFVYNEDAYIAVDGNIPHVDTLHMLLLKKEFLPKKDWSSYSQIVQNTKATCNKAAATYYFKILE